MGNQRFTELAPTENGGDDEIAQRAACAGACWRSSWGSEPTCSSSGTEAEPSNMASIVESEKPGGCSSAGTSAWTPCCLSAVGPQLRERAPASRATRLRGSRRARIETREGRNLTLGRPLRRRFQHHDGYGRNADTFHGHWRRGTSHRRGRPFRGVRGPGDRKDSPFRGRGDVRETGEHSGALKEVGFHPGVALSVFFRISAPQWVFGDLAADFFPSRRVPGLGFPQPLLTQTAIRRSQDLLLLSLFSSVALEQVKRTTLCRVSTKSFLFLTPPERLGTKLGSSTSPHPPATASASPVGTDIP